MTMILPLWLVVTQWVLLFALGFLVITLYRQVGLQLRFNDLGTDREGLPLGTSAPTFEYFDIRQALPAHFEPKEKWSLLMFADPGCVSCEQALIALERFMSKQGEAFQAFVATSAELSQIAAIQAFKRTSLPIGQVSRDIPYKQYQTLVTPFVFLIDPEGMIQAKGAVLNESSLPKIVQKGHRSALEVATSAR